MKAFELRIIFLLTVLMLPAFAGTAQRTAYWHQRVTLFDKIPVKDGDIVMLGNSITDGGEYNELFPGKPMVNRGISGDVVTGVAERIRQITKAKPSKVFLLIGINDIANGVPAWRISKNYEDLISTMVEKMPDTEIYIQSVMPIDNSFGKWPRLKGKENEVTLVNSQLKKIASNYNLTYIDLWPALATPEGSLKKEFTNDGLHLLGAGYKAWASAIEPFIYSEGK